MFKVRKKVNVENSGHFVHLWLNLSTIIPVECNKYVRQLFRAFLTDNHLIGPDSPFGSDTPLFIKDQLWLKIRHRCSDWWILWSELAIFSSLCLCVHIYICVCVFVCAHVCVCVCVCVCVRVWYLMVPPCSTHPLGVYRVYAGARHYCRL